jgi:MoxR-like ATPase
LPGKREKNLPHSIDETLSLLSGGNYVAGRPLATAVFLALRMGRPLFLEGEAGVGKTEIAKVLADTLGRRLIRLQCYEGLDVSSAVYEWNYSRQMIEIRLAEAKGDSSRKALESDIFSERFLIRRYLLEVLADYQVTIPEIGTVRAEKPPIVVITSNRTREIHDAVKRRCLYHWVDYPDAAAELEIIKRKAPRAQEILSREIVAFVQKLRSMDLFKQPGVAETIDWANAMVELDKVSLEPDTVNDTLGALLKYQDDVARVRGNEAARILTDIRAELAHSP